jgi:hypothetical protein
MGESLISYGVIEPNGLSSPLTEILRDPDSRRQVSDLLAACKREATEILRREEAAVRALAERLLEKEEVAGEELEELMQSKAVARATPAFRPALELVGESWHTPALLEASQRDGPQPQRPMPPPQPPTGTGGTGRADASTAGGEFEW